MLGHRQLNFDDYLAILRRRWWVILIPAIIGSLGTYLVSLSIPNQYTSRTLVLVEQQKVPDNFVKSVVTEDLGQRLGTMQEQILSRTRLQPIIERFGLFKDDQGRVPMEDLVDRLRKSISVNPIRSMVETRAGQLPGFSISFTAPNPRQAQQICTEITSMFMEENLRLREQRAEGTTQFLKDQLDQAKHKLDEQDARLAEFKKKYIGSLPGQEQTEMNMMMGTSSQLQAVTSILTRAQQDKTYLEALLAQQVAAWQATQAGDGANPEPDALQKQLDELQNQLVLTEARYTSDHPDVIKLKNDIAKLKKKIKEGETQPKNDSEEEKDKNKDKENGKDKLLVRQKEPPEIQQLRNQVHVAEVTIREKTREQEALKQQLSMFQSRLSLSPVVEQEYKEITRDYQTALEFYNELLAKKSQSEMATSLERRQQGEQFQVMDPADLPEKPSFPNRLAFAGGGLGCGLLLGLGIALLLEFRDRSLRTESDIKFYLGLPTLATVPTVGDENGFKLRFWKRAKNEEPKPRELIKV